MKQDGFGHEHPHEGLSNDWITPKHLVQLLGHFDLDPCASVTQPWHLADNEISPPRNGLNEPWEGRVFCNPPYGPNIPEWATKMAQHGDGILLIFARTETTAWKSIWQTGDAFLFLYGRISFYLPNGLKAQSGTAPSVFVAYGKENVECLRTCKIAGAFVERAMWIDGEKASGM